MSGIKIDFDAFLKALDDVDADADMALADKALLEEDGLDDDVRRALLRKVHQYGREKQETRTANATHENEIMEALERSQASVFGDSWPAHETGIELIRHLLDYHLAELLDQVLAKFVSTNPALKHNVEFNLTFQMRMLPLMYAAQKLKHQETFHVLMKHGFITKGDQFLPKDQVLPWMRVLDATEGAFYEAYTKHLNKPQPLVFVWNSVETSEVLEVKSPGSGDSPVLVPTVENVSRDAPYFKSGATIDCVAQSPHYMALESPHSNVGTPTVRSLVKR